MMKSLFCVLIFALTIVGQTARNFRTSTFASLGTPTENNVRWCPDCNVGVPCTGGGAGAYAYADGSSWVCTLHAPGGGTGSVTSVALSLPNIFSVSGSPVTSAGTLIGNLVTQSANRFFAGPTTGGAVTPTFRGIVAADLGTGTANSSTFLRGDLSWQSVASVGTVTSVAQTVPAEFSVAGSPITTTGTLAITKATQSANTVWAGPTSGGAAQPGFRGLVLADVPSIDETKLLFTDITTANASSLKHGLLPKLSGAGSDCLRGDGSWSFCAGSGGGDFSTNTTTSVTDQVMVAATTGGKTGTFATGTGVGILTAGVISYKTNPSGAFVGTTDSQVLTNKTISGASNTISSLAASTITSGVFAIGRLATGTPDGTKFVRDDGTLAVPAGTGVTSVAASVPSGFAVSGSPITSTGTLAISYASGQTANRFLATPNGSTGALSLRAIVPADFFTGTINTDRCVRVNTSGQVETASGDCATGGTVTSFSAGTLSPLFTTSVATSTTTPALSFTLSNQSGNTVFSSPSNGSSGTPSFRSLVAADLPSITESKFSFSDVTTANASTLAHGLLPKLSGSGSDCFRGDGTYIACTSGGGGGDFSTNTTTSVLNQVVVASGTGGKTGQFATGTGVGILTAGVLSFKTNPAGAFVGDTDAQTLSGKTLTTPTIASFVNAVHNHTNAAGGGQLTLASFSSATGSGAVVGQTGPSLVTPNIGVATATSINKVTINAPATSAALTLADGKTLTIGNTLTFTGTDSTTMAFPSASGSVLTADSTATVSNKTLVFPILAANSGLPVNCTIGQSFRNSSDSKVYFCFATNVWGEVLIAGASGTISPPNGGTGTANPSGTVTISGASSGSATFGAAFSAIPRCVVVPTSDVGSGVRFWVSATNSAVTVNTSSSVSVTFNYHCFAQ